MGNIKRSSNWKSEPYEVDQSVKLNQYLAICVGEGGKGWGRLEGVSFYKRLLSRPVNEKVHSHLEIASVKKTLPKFNSAIRPKYIYEA